MTGAPALTRPRRGNGAGQLHLLTWVTSLWVRTYDCTTPMAMMVAVMLWLDGTAGDPQSWHQVWLYFRTVITVLQQPGPVSANCQGSSRNPHSPGYIICQQNQ